MPICPSSCKNFCLVCAGQILCMLSQSPWVPMCNCPVLFRKVSLEVIQHLWFLQSYLPFSEDSEPWLERCDMSVLFRAKHLGFLFSHEHFKFRFVFFFHSLFDFLNPFWLGVGHNFLLGVCFLVIFLLWGCIPSLPPFLYPLFVPSPPPSTLLLLHWVLSPHVSSFCFLKQGLWPRLTPNSLSSCLSLLGFGITASHHYDHTDQVYQNVLLTYLHVKLVFLNFRMDWDSR